MPCTMVLKTRRPSYWTASIRIFDPACGITVDKDFRKLTENLTGVSITASRHGWGQEIILRLIDLVRSSLAPDSGGLRRRSVVACLILFTILSAGCRHGSTSSAELESNRPDKITDDSLRDILPAEASTIQEISSRPEQYLGKKLIVSGNLGDLELVDSSDGLSLLSIGLTDSESRPEKDEGSHTAAYLDFTERLNLVNRHLTDAAQNLDLTAFDSHSLELFSYSQKANGKRIRALSFFFQSKGSTEFGESTRKIADGYMKIGDAYFELSKLNPENSVATTIENAVPTDSVTTPVPEANRFEEDIAATNSAISGIADKLIENRYKILNHEVGVTADFGNKNTGYALMSIGENFSANSWLSKKEDDTRSHEFWRTMGDVFYLFGTAITEIESGIQDLIRLSAVGPLIVLPGLDTDTVKLECAYLGYNAHILADCKEKLSQLGRFAPVTVEGYLIKGNILEKINKIWLKMELISIDGLTFELTYDDYHRTWKNISGIYEFMKEASP